MIYYCIMKILLIIFFLLLFFIYIKSKLSKKKYTVSSKLRPLHKIQKEQRKKIIQKINQQPNKEIVEKEVIVSKEDMKPYIERFEKAWKPVGKLNGKCPYCGHKFDKIPQSKRKCPSCKETIYPRVIPQSKQKSLLRLEDIPVLDKQKSAITYISIYTSKKEPDYQKAHKELEKKFGFKPKKNDVLWRLFNERVVQTTIDQDFGFLMIAYFEAAEILRGEKKFLQTLLYYFYICYLELNGATNNMRKYNEYDFDQKAFQKKISEIAPGLIFDINKLVVLADLTMDELEEIYYYSINTYNSFPYPIYSNAESWEHIKKAFEEHNSL